MSGYFKFFGFNLEVWCPYWQI